MSDIDDPIAAEEEVPIAPRFRRVIALAVDFALCIGAIHLAFGLGALAVPVDSATAFYAVLIPSSFLGLGYLLLLPSRANTLGKWLFGIRVERTLSVANEVRPSVRAMFLRTMLLGLWPINLLMVLFSAQRRHLGDLLAKTTVRFPHPRNLAVGLVVGVLVAVLALKVGALSLKAAATRTQAYAAAVSALPHAPDGLPASFVIGERVARFDIAANGELWRVEVTRDAESWEAGLPETIDSVGLGATFAFGAGSVSNSF